jgi:hypothetical protein
VLFLTNNSMKSRAAYVHKFQQLGVAASVVSCGLGAGAAGGPAAAQAPRRQQAGS